MTTHKAEKGGPREPHNIPIRFYRITQPGTDAAAWRALFLKLEKKLEDACLRGVHPDAPRKKAGKNKKSKTGLSFRRHLRAKLRDPEFRRLYESADIELRKRLESPL